MKQLKKLTTKEIELVKKRQSEMLFNYPEYRKGQAFFNALCDLFVEHAELIRGTNYDPFYIDSKQKDCIDFLKNKL